VMILSFGKVVQIICTIMNLATMAALKEFDGKQPCMGNVYIIMRALRHHVAALHNAPCGTLRSCPEEHRSHGCKRPPLYRCSSQSTPH
jgi:hypothetical protein